MLKVETWPIDKLVPYIRNPRKNEEAVPKMASLIKEFGFKIPVVVRSDGELIDGHLRLKAARMLGLKEVPVILADEWTKEQVKAFRIAVNKSAEWADWDEEYLKLELEELRDMNFDLNLTGFGDMELTETLEDLTPDPVDAEEYKDFEGDEDDLLVSKRVIIVFKDEEEMFIRKMLKLTSDEHIAVLYKADDLAKRFEENGDD